MAPGLDLVGVGSPLMDLVAPVPEEFLGRVSGAKGGMILVDEPEMARIQSLLPAEPVRTTGGSAANTVFNAARLGLRTAYVGKVGRDELGAAYRRYYGEVGVETGRFKEGAAATGRCLALVTPDAQRTMRVCLGAAATLAPEEISAEDFRGCRHAHVEGYLVFNRALCEKVLDSARAAGCTVSLDLASFEVVTASRDWLLDQFRRGVDVAFANEDEIRALFPDGGADYPALARRLAALGPLAAVKVGKDGAWLARGGELHRVAPVRVDDLLDTIGAGDAWAAGFLSGYLRGRPLPECGALASLLGAETVRHWGPLIPATAWGAVHRRARALFPAEVK